MSDVGVDHEMQALARLASQASRSLRLLPGMQKNACLQAFGSALLQSADAILKAARDDAAHARAHGAPTHVVQAIALSRIDIEAKARLAATLAGLPDPVGKVESTWIRPNGLKIEKTRVPLGVVAVLAEFDAGAVIDAVLLCIKAGDAVVVFAGPMVYRTCRAVAQALSTAPLPGQMTLPPVHFVLGHDREARQALLCQRGLVDVAIPVGSASWVDETVQEARVPVLGQTCHRRHLYIDEEAEVSMAVAIVRDLATADPAGDGPDTILIHRAIAARVLPEIVDGFLERGVRLAVDPDVSRLLADLQIAAPATAPAADAAVCIALVDGVDAAAAVIAEHGPGYSDGVVTNDRATATRFAAQVDSACIYLNASTRFTDGGQFGMGAQVTINTGRLHARGPLGIDELTTCRYLVTGKGQVLG